MNKRTLMNGLGCLLLAFVFVGQAVAQTCVQPPSGMVSWWDADSVSGTTAFDIQDGNDGALVNGATTSTGIVGDAFSLDGINDYVAISDSNDWDFGTGDFTIDFWEKSGGNGRMHALSFEPNFGTRNLDFDFDDPDSGGWGLWVFWNGRGEHRIRVGSVGDYTDGQWYHTTFTSSGSDMTLYVNCSSVVSTTYIDAID